MQNWQESLENVRDFLAKMAEVLYVIFICVFLAILIIGLPAGIYWLIEKIAGAPAC